MTENVITVAWGRCGASDVRNYSLLNKVCWTVADRERIMRYGRCVVCGQGILRCKCRMVNWKYVAVGVGRL